MNRCGRPRASRFFGVLKILGVAGTLCAMGFLCGCETAKGSAMDLGGLKKADAWFREHYW